MRTFLIFCLPCSEWQRCLPVCRDLPRWEPGRTSVSPARGDSGPCPGLCCPANFAQAQTGSDLRLIHPDHQRTCRSRHYARPTWSWGDRSGRSRQASWPSVRVPHSQCKSEICIKKLDYTWNRSDPDRHRPASQYIVSVFMRISHSKWWTLPWSPPARTEGLPWQPGSQLARGKYRESRLELRWRKALNFDDIPTFTTSTKTSDCQVTRSKAEHFAGLLRQRIEAGILTVEFILFSDITIC